MHVASVLWRNHVFGVDRTVRSFLNGLNTIAQVTMDTQGPIEHIKTDSQPRNQRGAIELCGTSAFERLPLELRRQIYHYVHSIQTVWIDSPSITKVDSLFQLRSWLGRWGSLTQHGHSFERLSPLLFVNHTIGDDVLRYLFEERVLGIRRKEPCPSGTPRTFLTHLPKLLGWFNLKSLELSLLVKRYPGDAYHANNHTQLSALSDLCPNLRDLFVWVWIVDDYSIAKATDIALGCNLSSVEKALEFPQSILEEFGFDQITKLPDLKSCTLDLHLLGWYDRYHAERFAFERAIHQIVEECLEDNGPRSPRSEKVVVKVNGKQQQR